MRSPPGTANGGAVDSCGLCGPPVVVHCKGSEGYTLVLQTHRAHHIDAGSGRNKNLIRETKKQGPRPLLNASLPEPAIAGSKRGCICAKEEGRARYLGGQVSDPECCAKIPGVANNGVEMSFADHFPNPRIPQAEESLVARAPVGNMCPGVAIEQRNVPLHGRAELRIMGFFGAPQRTKGDVELQIGSYGHAPEYGNVI